MSTVNKYLVATVVFLSLALAVSQHTIYTQGKTIETYKEVVVVQQTTIAEQDNVIKRAMDGMRTLGHMIDSMGGK